MSQDRARQPRRTTSGDSQRLDPRNGPAILFFSGGSALRELSRALAELTHNSIHLITPFDSGGSSAALRQAFAMPAVGDLRNRLMALADRDHPGRARVHDLLSHRLPAAEPMHRLQAILASLARGDHPLAVCVPQPQRAVATGLLRHFMAVMPPDFDLRGASIGNLALTAAYLRHGRDIDRAVAVLSRLVGARGHVRPIVGRDLTLNAELEGGLLVAGQHRLTGKACAPIKAPVVRVYLSASQTDHTPIHEPLDKPSLDHIRKASLVCYPMGSFYSSLVANLLPDGVGAALAANPCPKVFVPGTGRDPETLGLDLPGRVAMLLRTLRANGAADVPIRSLMTHVIVDAASGDYPQPLGLDRIRELGVTVADRPLVTARSKPRLDEHALIDYLMALANGKDEA